MNVMKVPSRFIGCVAMGTLLSVAVGELGTVVKCNSIFYNGIMLPGRFLWTAGDGDVGVVGVDTERVYYNKGGDELIHLLIHSWMDEWVNKWIDRWKIGQVEWWMNDVMTEWIENYLHELIQCESVC